MVCHVTLVRTTTAAYISSIFKTTFELGKIVTKTIIPHAGSL